MQENSGGHGKRKRQRRLPGDTHTNMESALLKITHPEAAFTSGLFSFTTVIQREDGLKAMLFYRNHPNRDDGSPMACDSFTCTITGARPQHRGRAAETQGFC